MNYQDKELIRNKKRIHSVFYEGKLNRCPLHEEVNTVCQKIDLIKEKIESNKIHGFFMYQFSKKSRWFKRPDKKYQKEINKIKELINEINKDPIVNIEFLPRTTTFDVKTCEFCKIIRSSDFGLALLTPWNPNVYLEIGMFLSLGKKVIFFNNEKISKKAPFDITPYFYLPFSNLLELETNWNQNIPHFIERLKNFYLKPTIEELILLIPDKEGYKLVEKLVREIYKNFLDGVHWKVYCKSKFLICYLLTIGRDFSKMGTEPNLTTLTGDFSEMEVRNFLFSDIIDSASNLGFPEIIPKLKEIAELIRKLNIKEIIFQWTDNKIIDEILKDYIEQNFHPKQHARFNFKFLNHHEGWIKEFGFEQKEWLANHNLLNKDNEEKEEYYQKLLIDCRNKITNSVANEMMDLAFYFFEKFFKKYSL